MRHPSDGTLRRLLDEPAGVPDADRTHIAGCPVCLAGLTSAQEDAAAAGTALHAEVSADVDAAWGRFVPALGGRKPAPVAAPARRWRSVLRGPAVAVLGVVVVLTGAGVAAAAGWLQIFRTEQIAPVPVTRADLVALPALSAYGALEITEQPDVHPVADAAAAGAVTGLDVPQVGELPAGVTGEPAYTAGGQVSAVFTFS